jgi:hypothetical protein
MRKVLYYVVVIIGAIQIIGYLVGSKELTGLGKAYCSSPLPIVFTEVKGVETFAADFYLSYTSVESDERQEVKISPELYTKLEGPYNRRNVYGAAISYGPVMPEELWRSVLEYGICRGTLSQELGLPADAHAVEIRIDSRTAGKNDSWTLNIDCP